MKTFLPLMIEVVFLLLTQVEGIPILKRGGTETTSSGDTDTPVTTTELGPLNEDSTGYIQYYEGTLPLVISAPHGGDKKPDDITDRDCPPLSTTCITTQDAYIEEIARNLAARMYELTGCHAHLVISTLHREKLDPNRDEDDMAFNDDTAEDAWKNYHSFIRTAKASFSSIRPGVVVDVHGHPGKMIQLGYLITAAQTKLTDEKLDSKFEADILDTSIRSLAEENPPLSELVRGDDSLGDLLWKNGEYESVPSPRNPNALYFFSGGYIVREHGSVENGNVDAILLELGMALRDNDRDEFVEDFGEILVDYMEKWYLESGETFCSMTGV